jgi:hypothetical protein
MRIPHCVLLAVCCYCAPTLSKEPFALLGMGSLKCAAFVNSYHDPQGKDILARPIFSWAQGWISARNVVGRALPLTVAGALPAEALEAMLVSECEDRPQDEVWQAVDDLYERLAKKGI